MKLLVINPGSTSTKVSLFENRQVLFEENIFHDAPELLRFPTVNDQMDFRKALILSLLEKHGCPVEETDVFVGRGGSAYSQRDPRAVPQRPVPRAQPESGGPQTRRAHGPPV